MPSFLFFFFSWDTPYVAQAGLELTMKPRLVLNLKSPSLSLLSARITEVYHRAPPWKYFFSCIVWMMTRKKSAHVQYRHSFLLPIIFNLWVETDALWQVRKLRHREIEHLLRPCSSTPDHKTDLERIWENGMVLIVRKGRTQWPRTPTKGLSSLY
jgi:hypothetical protein